MRCRAVANVHAIPLTVGWNRSAQRHYPFIFSAGDERCRWR
jgi:hypothetical protein